MPAQYKAIISILALIVGAGMYVYEKGIGDEVTGWVAVGLSCLMVLAIWIFPETGNRKKI